ncbi:MAG: 3-hydroxyacyl-CoA dehydrogenase family protein [Thermomicrobiales bacterium]|nr:3-hydroxyacyl-CoA dehydrogenase family protein [Thermomicrobiales bacterium]
MRRVAVIGAGTMGAQIAQQTALHGFDVALFDVEPARVAAAAARNRKQLMRRVEKAQLSAGDAESALARVRPSESLADAAADADLVIEAAIEEIDVKRAIFADLDRLTPPDAILATNSSTMTMSEISERLSGRARTLALHFFNPVLVMRLVEIAPAPYTDPSHVAAAEWFVRAIDREPVVLHKEIPGFLVNRVLWALRREAMWLADNGYADPRDIDRAIKLGLNHPMGPFELADFNGLDVILLAQRHRFARSGDDADRPPRILEELVERGDLGRKTGRGFYDYPDHAEKERTR